MKNLSLFVVVQFQCVLHVINHNKKVLKCLIKVKISKV